MNTGYVQWQRLKSNLKKWGKVLSGLNSYIFGKPHNLDLAPVVVTAKRNKEFYGRGK
jgi:hypothetical protein